MIKKKHFFVLTALLFCFLSLSAETIDKDIFALRRHKVMGQLEDNSIAILRNPKPVIRNNDQEYFYRTDSNFYYLTGLDEPGSIMVLIPGVERQFILFVKPSNLTDAMWHGDLNGIDGAVQTFGADKSYALDQFQEMVRMMVMEKDVIYMDYDDKELYEMIISNFPYRHGVVRRKN